MDELIRQGLYLDDKKREGARLTIELLAEQIKKGEAIIYKKRKRAGNISES
jgi:hypothetical protein